MLRVTWKDQGSGNRKGHLWMRVAPSEKWYKLSEEVASHRWRTEVFHLPEELFENGQMAEGTMELASESHFSDSRVYRDMTGYWVHIM